MIIHSQNTIHWLIALPALVYVVLRAVLLDFTYDECWTYLGYAQGSVVDAVLNTYPAANNHVLNSLAMKVSAHLFGNAPFALRIPVMIGFIAYCAAVLMLLRKLPKWWSISLKVGLLYQPYILDYFVAARGYGLALPALLWSILFLHRFINDGKTTGLWWGALCAFLMAWANFTYLLPFSIWWGLALISAWQQRVLKNFFTALGVFGVLAVALFLPALWALIKAEELYYGASSLNQTFQSLGARFFYQLREERTYGFVLPLLIGLSLLGWRLRNKQGLQFAALSACLLSGSLILSVLQHYIMGSPYLIDRTGLFLIPLGLLSLTGLAFWLPQLHGRFIALALMLLFAFNFFKAVNLTHLIDFKDYADVSKAMIQLNVLAPVQEQDEIILGKSTYLNAPINYYKQRLAMDHLAHSGLAYCDDQSYQFYYIFARDLACVEGMVVDTLAYYPVSDTYLMHQKEEDFTDR